MNLSGLRREILKAKAAIPDPAANKARVVVPVDCPPEELEELVKAHREATRYRGKVVVTVASMPADAWNEAWNPDV